MNTAFKGSWDPDNPMTDAQLEEVKVTTSYPTKPKKRRTRQKTSRRFMDKTNTKIRAHLKANPDTWFSLEDLLEVAIPEYVAAPESWDAEKLNMRRRLQYAYENKEIGVRRAGVSNLYKHKPDNNPDQSDSPQPSTQDSADSHIALFDFQVFDDHVRISHDTAIRLMKAIGGPE